MSRFVKLAAKAEKEGVSVFDYYTPYKKAPTRVDDAWDIISQEIAKMKTAGEVFELLVKMKQSDSKDE